MKKLFSLLFLLSIFVATSSILGQSHTPLPDPLASKIQGNYFVHEGYQFDISQILNDEHLQDILIQLEWQVYFVNVLKLPSQIQDFFKSIPVVVAPQAGNRDDKFITVTSNNLYYLQLNWVAYKHEDALLLSEFFVALLEIYLPQGANNPDIVKYFNQAKSLPCYQAEKPFWISNTSSDAIYYFFINSAMSYLRGSFSEEPFTCYKIQKTQPEFFHYLENLFGPYSGFINQSFSYHGFHFNWSQMDDFSHSKEIFNECMRQVDYIESTQASKNVIDFFKTVPVKLKLDYEMYSVSGHALGAYSPLKQMISLNAKDASFSFLNGRQSDVPLLHELLHAFHDQVLLDGDNNPYISKFFEDAMEHRYYYDSKNHFNYWMTNEYEFFACTATAFLNNYTPDEPFNRKNICKHQPDYYLYLQNIFGTAHDDMNIMERSLMANAVDHLY